MPEFSRLEWEIGIFFLDGGSTTSTRPGHCRLLGEEMCFCTGSRLGVLQYYGWTSTNTWYSTFEWSAYTSNESVHAYMNIHCTVPRIGHWSTNL
jgi:hypothetical protein